MALEMSEQHSSIDPEEVARYTALANLWWDKSGPFWPLHRLNELRVGYIREQLCRWFQLDHQAQKPLEGLRILDIGCGGGILSEAVANGGATVHGIDVVERNIAIAHHHAQQNQLNIHYQMITAEELAQQGKHYDAVLNMEVVEHVAHLSGFVHACNQLVRPGGLMFIATINRTVLAWLIAIIGAEYILRWLPRGTHQWRRFPKPQELETLLNKDQLRIIDQSGVKVNPLTRRMTLTPFMGVNYMLVAQR
ncbi:MAG: bifunctional 2-polyprenyl-6-hydroxyphenol methylase/3-demethylubiquinol 3-O-methyltransferase UbiG [Candidatus Competibacteraceae bacterium]|jgi:2-polyprenyl-6-hydroxyphenyl methylase/3-demethylubiquinone-9 3-methyltransferase|nr:bifunctional 2-polyprenyl-6-hydroxyphenol methylase/3-demethylubiquinol 3-O-methyltransferase UbiG [Candidatus Competibacteraceae bacterium]